MKPVPLVPRPSTLVDELGLQVSLCEVEKASFLEFTEESKFARKTYYFHPKSQLGGM